MTTPASELRKLLEAIHYGENSYVQRAQELHGGTYPFVKYALSLLEEIEIFLRAEGTVESDHVEFLHSLHAAILQPETNWEAIYDDSYLPPWVFTQLGLIDRLMAKSNVVARTISAEEVEDLKMSFKEIDACLGDMGQENTDVANYLRELCRQGVELIDRGLESDLEMVSFRLRNLAFETIGAFATLLSILPEETVKERGERFQATFFRMVRTSSIWIGQATAAAAGNLLAAGTLLAITS